MRGPEAEAVQVVVVGLQPVCMWWAPLLQWAAAGDVSGHVAEAEWLGEGSAMALPWWYELRKNESRCELSGVKSEGMWCSRKGRRVGTQAQTMAAVNSSCLFSHPNHRCG